jgi:ERCC4-related helicase
MEVDLVVCFDANVSPLRMIQRMGRTGRKHDGRVDILCHFHFHFHSEDCKTVCFCSSLRSFQLDP